MQLIYPTLYVLQYCSIAKFKYPVYPAFSVFQAYTILAVAYIVVLQRIYHNGTIKQSHKLCMYISINIHIYARIVSPISSYISI